MGQPRRAAAGGAASPRPPRPRGGHPARGRGRSPFFPRGAAPPRPPPPGGSTPGGGGFSFFFWGGGGPPPGKPAWRAVSPSVKRAVPPHPSPPPGAAPPPGGAPPHDPIRRRRADLPARRP